MTDADTRTIESLAVAVLEGVAKGVVHLTVGNVHPPGRVVHPRSVPTSDVSTPRCSSCPEFTPDRARAWIAAGDGPGLAPTRQVVFADIDIGHWPMVSRTIALAHVIHDATEAR